MTKKIHIQVLVVIAVLFLVLQIFFSVHSSQTFLSQLGFIQITIISSFIFAFILGQKMKVGYTFVLIFNYQMVFVLLLYSFYTFVYENPLGFSPKDAATYHSLGLTLQNMDFSSSVEYLLRDGKIADLGFPILLKGVYSLGGNEILSMKLLNVSFHMFTCRFLFRITQFLKLNGTVSKNALLLFGLNPISIYFNASGLKEPFLVFLVTLCFYLFYKAYLQKNVWPFVAGFVVLFLTGLFRVPYPILIFISFALYIFLAIDGPYKLPIRLFFVLSAIALFGIVLFFVWDELRLILAIDRTSTVTHRIGRTPGVFEYFVMAISGLIGPIPSFSYNPNSDNYLLQTAGNTVKLLISYFFLIGSYKIIKYKLQKFYPLMVFILSNIVMLTYAGATLDHRLLYPFIPLYLLIAAYGYSFKQNTNFSLVKYSPYVAFVLALIIGYNFT